VLVYQDACHMLHGQRLSQEPRQLLRQIPGLELRDPLDAALCCGSSGVYNLLQPKVADELGSQKVQNLLRTGAQGIVSANIGCRLQIQKHLHCQGKQEIPIFHPMELLDRAMQPQQGS
ncbi:MAG: (Fe-S)-binding protein, partial [Thermostichus sp. DG_1_5_bins_95]